MGDHHVDEHVVCKHCGAQSREGFVASDRRSCPDNDNPYQQNVYHNWVPADEAHQYDVEVA